jgi:transcriptional regulator with XRE-family HTH domain
MLHIYYKFNFFGGKMKKAGVVDIKLGQNIVKSRIAAGFSRKELADLMGITHQQLQKYEHGINRICVSRLLDVSKALKVPVTKLLDLDSAESQIGYDKDSKSLSDIMKHINKIKDEAKLDAIKNLVKSISVTEVGNGANLYS